MAYVENRELSDTIAEKLKIETTSGFNKWISAQAEDPIHQMLLVYAIWEGLTDNDTYFCPESFYSNLPRHSMHPSKENRMLFHGTHPLLRKKKYRDKISAIC